MPKTSTNSMGVRLARAIRPNPSIIGLRPRIAAARPTPNAVTTELTGAGRYRDILSMKDAGADLLLDFVDGGLASTIGPETVVRPALRNVLSRVAIWSPDVAVIEAGASPLEPYNGRLAIEMLHDSVKFTVLCASDPYSVLGVTTAYNRSPDIVTGIAASTDAATALVRRLSGIPAFNILDKHGATVFERVMMERMEPHLRQSSPLAV